MPWISSKIIFVASSCSAGSQVPFSKSMNAKLISSLNIRHQQTTASDRRCPLQSDCFPFGWATCIFLSILNSGLDPCGHGLYQVVWLNHYRLNSSQDGLQRAMKGISDSVQLHTMPVPVALSPSPKGQMV